MGYNPYMCILCHDIKDNGWSFMDNYEKCDEICERLGLIYDGIRNEKLHKAGYSFRSTYPGYPLNSDVCNVCWQMGKSETPFFEVDHTKQERQKYWKNHTKNRNRIDYTKQERQEYWKDRSKKTKDEKVVETKS